MQKLHIKITKKAAKSEKRKQKKERISVPFLYTKKLCEPFLSTSTEVETAQVATSKLPYGTRNGPLSAATFLS